MSKTKISETQTLKFHEYVADRLKSRSASEKVVQKLKRGFHSDRINSIHKCALINSSSVCLTTLRRCFSDGSYYLRPVHTSPKRQISTIEDWASGRGIAFQSPSNSLRGIGSLQTEIKSINKSTVEFAAYYKLSGNTEGPVDQFVPRIERAFTTLGLKFDAKDVWCLFVVRATKQPGRYTGKDNSKNGLYLPTHMFATYYVDADKAGRSDVTISHELETLNQVLIQCSSLFDEMDVDASLDAEIFELDGFEMVSQLKSTFLRTDLAPADKIAFMAERLRLLLKRQLTAHHVSNVKIDPQVYYVSLAYSRENSTSHRPIFRVYPHHYRQKFPVGSFFISHPDHVSVSKYLLRHYFQWHIENASDDGGRRFCVGREAGGAAVKLATKFHNSFSTPVGEMTAIDDIADYETISEIVAPTHSDQFFVSAPVQNGKGVDLPGQLMDNAWETLNRRISHDHESKAIAAFVVEGMDAPRQRKDGKSKPFRQLPRGILAIESQIRDFLSAEELKSLRKIVAAISPLIRHLFHENSLLDFRSELSGAYDGFVPSKIKDGRVKKLISRLLLAAMSLDVELLGEIISDKRVKELFPRELEIVSDLHNEALKESGISDIKILNSAEKRKDKIVQDRVGRRFNNSVEFLIGLSNTELADPTRVRDLEKAIAFLEACPQNFAWAGYGPSLAEALGDRTHNSLPNFRLIAPGFSAAGLYMAAIEHEIQQVAKLSSLRKLKHELDNYKNFVRYKLLLAARTPSNGLSFDSMGSLGQSFGEQEGAEIEIDDAYGDSAYGVLVSDLASGADPILQRTGATNPEKIVRTLLNNFAKAANRAPSELSSDDSDVIDISKALEHFFIVSLALWRSKRSLKSLDSEGSTISGFIRETYEVGKTEEEVVTTFTRLKSGAQNSEFSHDEGEFRLKGFPDLKKLGSLSSLEQFSFDGDRDYLDASAIVHGDLNARNLAWAAAIKHFVMIDFEHTKEGLWGTDQARLVINLVVDIYSGLVDAPTGIHTSVEKALIWLGDLWNSLGTNASLSPLLKDSFTDGTEAPISVVTILARILSTFYRFQAGKEPDEELLAKKWHTVLRAMLLTSAIKELEYSVINVRRAGLNEAQIQAVNNLDFNNQISQTLADLCAIEEFTGEGSRVLEQRNTVARYIISLNLLKKLGLDSEGSGS